MEQFHNLRTLSTSIALEAAELMEHTQWAKDAELPALAQQHRDALAEEMADIAILRTLPRPSSRGTWPMTWAWTLKPPCARSCGRTPPSTRCARGEGEGGGDEV